MSNSPWIIKPNILLMGHGTEVHLMQREWTGMLSLRIMFTEDMYRETEVNNGLSYLSSRMLLEGSERWSSTQALNLYLEKYAIEAMALPGGLQFTCLKESWINLLTVIDELLNRPKLNEERLLKVKRQIQQELKSSMDDSDQLAYLELRKSVFNSPPGTLLSTGTPESILNLTSKQVIEYWGSNLHANGIKLFMVSSMSATSIENDLEKVLPTVIKKSAWNHSFPEITTTKQIQKKFVFKDRKKATIALGHIGIRRWSRDYTTLKLVDQVLGASSGFTSRLAGQLREELGLCYYIYGDVCSTAGRIPGLFQIVMGTSPQNVEEAIMQIQRTVGNLLAEGPELMELEDARSFLLGSMAFSFETNNSMLQLMVEKYHYGLDETFLLEERQKLKHVNSEEFHIVSSTYLDAASLHAVVVGATAPSGWVSET